MASPETTELRAMDDAGLTEELGEAHQSLFNLRFQGATRQLADVSQVGKARKRVARIETLLRERSILAEVDAAAADEPDVEEADAGDDETTADDADGGSEDNDGSEDDDGSEDED
jgi:large subunit ribosomal protein L29